jgi:hypothetical protein
MAYSTSYSSPHGGGHNAPNWTTQQNWANPSVEAEWSPDLDPSDMQELREAEQDPGKIVSKLPRESTRLGYYSTVCLLFNRLIGKSQA